MEEAVLSHTHLIHRWFEKVWCSPRCEDTIDELMNSQSKLNGLGATPLGRDDFRAFRNHLLSQFPDIKVSVTQTIEQGDTVAFHAVVTGTQPGNDSPFQFGGTGIVRFADGQIVESHETWDMLGLLAQIGEVNQAALGTYLGLT